MIFPPEFNFVTVQLGLRGKETQAGSFGQILLSDGETVSKVRYWASIYYTAAVEFTTSQGVVHGPWGKSDGAGTVLQVGVSKMVSVEQYQQHS